MVKALPDRQRGIQTHTRNLHCRSTGRSQFVEDHLEILKALLVVKANRFGLSTCGRQACSTTSDLGPSSTAPNQRCV